METTITLTLAVPDEMADPSDSTGLTNEGYETLVLALSNLGFDIEIGPTRSTR